ncbi:hypothetical protein L6452_14003 [Arctium lappa]|uniref:Uncharacterized protein n=1 Tax=Arctium lappa TaxID=4217 RepID=A0ACB9CK78_ARCLA|nr:hypothetical protein L6452_14003 [Arctium lappa]
MKKEIACVDCEGIWPSIGIWVFQDFEEWRKEKEFDFASYYQFSDRPFLLNPYRQHHTLPLLLFSRLIDSDHTESTTMEDFFYLLLDGSKDFRQP